MKREITKVAIDDGSSAIKFMVDGKVDVFDSTVQGRIQWDNDDPEPCQFRIGKDQYGVVDNTDERIDTSSPEYQTSPVNRVLVHSALIKAGVKGDVEIGVTIPLEKYYLPDGTINETLKQKKRDNIMGNLKHELHELDYNIVEVHVFPECQVGFRAIHKKKGLKGYSICVDVGGFTTDIGVFTGKSLNKSKTISNGTIECIHQLEGDIRSEFGFTGNIPFSTIANALVTGKFRKQCVAKYCKEAIANVVNKALEEADELTDIESCDNILFIGGGSKFVKKYSGIADYSLISEDPQFDNVRGVYARLMGEI